MVAILLHLIGMEQYMIRKNICGCNGESFTCLRNLLLPEAEMTNGLLLRPKAMISLHSTENQKMELTILH